MKSRDQEPGIRDQETERLAELLRSAAAPVGDGVEPGRDLWPAMRHRLDEPATLRSVPWFDWALAGGVAVFAVAFPAAVPMLLYYL